MSRRISIALFVAAIIIGGTSGDVQARVWVDSEGRTVDAEFIKYEGTTVHLRRNDTGAEIEVAYSKFSDADKQEIDSLHEQATRKPESSPAAEMKEDSSATAAMEKEAREAEARRELKGNRKWADEEGNQIQAKFVRIYEGNVILLQGNKGHNVDFYKLSDADQSFLRTHLEALGQGNDVPPVVAKSVDNNVGEGAIAGSTPGGMNFEGSLGASTANNGGAMANNSAGTTTKSPPPLNETDQQRRIREYQEKFANSSLPSTPASTPAAMPQPEQIVSNTPAPASMPSETSPPPESNVASYDPWADKQAGPTNVAPPKVNPPKSTAPKPKSNNSVANNRPSMPRSGAAGMGREYVWECQTCHTQFDTEKKPSFCYFCMSLRVGFFVVLTIVGAAIRGVMSG